MDSMMKIHRIGIPKHLSQAQIPHILPFISVHCPLVDRVLGLTDHHLKVLANIMRPEMRVFISRWQGIHSAHVVNPFPFIYQLSVECVKNTIFTFLTHTHTFFGASLSSFGGWHPQCSLINRPSTNLFLSLQSILNNPC